MKWVVMFLVSITCFALSTGECGAAVNLQSELSDKAESLLQSGQFANLDSMAQALEQKGARFPGGNPQVYALYMALGAISDATCGCSHGRIPFAVKEKSVEKWLSAEPKSSPAHMTMAMLWINYAWAARGGDFAPLVSPDRWRDYHDRLRTANAFVAQLDPTHDIFVLYERSLLAEASPSPRDAIMEAYKEVVRADPAWFPIYARQAEMLKEKWYGEPGELGSFAKSLLQTPGGDIGQTAYAELATAIVGGIAYNDGFEAVGDNWPALKQAYAAKERRYGLSEEDAYALLQYAAVFHDTDAVSGALRHVRDYADQGYALDMNNLGHAYLFGTGVPVQRDIAESWYRKGAALGNVISEYQLGRILEGEKGGGAEALKWYGLAGAQGFSDAVNNTGFMFENGTGVTQDYTKAAQLYEKAAAMGDHRAEFHLGSLYDRGLGVVKDDVLALKWMRKAAEDGDRDARTWLRARPEPRPGGPL